MAMLQSSTIEEQILYWLSADLRARALAERLLQRFAVTVGDLPASAAHHHAEPGGLYRHSVEVALKALEEFEGKMEMERRPDGSVDSFRSAHNRSRWQYATFIAALCHDLVKLFDLEVKGKGQTWCPLHEPYDAFGHRTKTPVARLMQRAPGLTFTLDLQIEQLAQVMTQSRDERCVLPAGAVVGTAKAVHAAVWPPFHLHLALELFQSFERYLDGMPVEPAGLGVMMRGAGWQIAHGYGKPLEQPFSQRPRPQVCREPVENLFLDCARLQHCHDALIVGGSPTLKTHPQEPPSRVGRKPNGKRGSSQRPPAVNLGEDSPPPFRLRWR